MLYKSEQRLLKVYTYNTHTQHDTHIWEMLIVLFPLSPFFRGRRQGRQPLNIMNPPVNWGVQLGCLDFIVLNGGSTG